MILFSRYCLIMNWYSGLKYARRNDGTLNNFMYNYDDYDYIVKVNLFPI